MFILFSASVPGSVMLMGEHAVLFDKAALVCAVNKRISVVLQPNSDSDLIKIYSDIGTYSSNRFQLINDEKFNFILAVLGYFQDKFQCGFSLTVSSEFSEKLGLGSSAAVTVAVIAVVHNWLNNKRIQDFSLFQLARNLIRKVQGRGSGADVAASVYGGVIFFQQNRQPVKLDVTELPIVLIYSGEKRKTKDVIKQVMSDRQAKIACYDDYFEAINQIVLSARSAIENKHTKLLGQLLNENAKIMKAMNLSTDPIDFVLGQLTAAHTILGAKISGSGLGDCVVGLGQLDAAAEILFKSADYPGVRYLSGVNFETGGVYYECE